MKKEAEKVLFLAILLIFLLNFASAAFTIGNISNSIEKIYSQKEAITGWINISLDKEPSDSVLSDSFGNSITLIGALNKTPWIRYSCIPNGCGPGYTAINEESSKEFSVGKYEQKILGFKITGEIKTIESIGFKMNSSAGESCENQIKIDFLSDGLNEIVNTNASKLNDEAICSSDKYGCFDSSKGGYTEYILSKIPYCQKFLFSDSPAFRIGAWVKKISEISKINMSIYDKEGKKIKECTLPEATEEGSEIYCNITYSQKNPEENYVCISSNDSNSDYKIRGYNAGTDGCGFYGEPVKTSAPAAYQIFVQGKKFGSVGNLSIIDSFSETETLGGISESYIKERYPGSGGTTNCSETGCIIPIKFLSREQQTITLSDLILSYEISIGSTKDNKFYELSETPSIIISGFQSINLKSLNFSASGKFGNHNYTLKLGEKTIFTENISIEKSPTIDYIEPVVAIAGYPTEFTVSAIASDENSTITTYYWDFGDNTSRQTTSINKITHTYPAIGTFKIKIGVADSSQKSADKEFEIQTQTPKFAVENAINKKLKDITNVKSQISSYPTYSQKYLENILNISNSESEIKDVQRDYALANSDEEYISLMGKIVSLDIPESIIAKKEGNSLEFVPDRSQINLEAIKEIAGGEYNSSVNSERYIDAVLSWIVENIDAKIIFKEIYASYGAGKENFLFSSFEISIKEKNSFEYAPSIILKQMENMAFEEKYQESASGYYGIPMKEAEKAISFITSEKTSYENLPIFVSPPIKNIQLKEEINPTRADNKISIKQLLFLVAIISFILAIGILSYIIMQRWYKFRYENYLFKDRNKLYNLVIYIENSNEKGNSDEEIRKNLKNAGWNLEQVDYAMKKYYGKRTGMVEIPLDKIFEKIMKRKMQKTEKIPEKKQEYTKFNKLIK